MKFKYGVELKVSRGELDRSVCPFKAASKGRRDLKAGENFGKRKRKGRSEYNKETLSTGAAESKGIVCLGIGSATRSISAPQGTNTTNARGLRPKRVGFGGVTKV